MPGMTRYAYQPIDSSKIRSRSIQTRTTKVGVDQFGTVYQKDSGLDGWIRSLPKSWQAPGFAMLLTRSCQQDP